MTICHGFESKGWAMSAGTKAELREMGILVHTGTHALGSDFGASSLPIMEGPRSRKSCAIPSIDSPGA